MIAARRGISIGPSCFRLRANAFVCIRTNGVVYPVSMSFYIDHLTWGDNRLAAVENAARWCNGDSSTDGSGGFATGQNKYRCYNAPFNNNGIDHCIRNERD
jgi:hypothetical protein